MATSIQKWQRRTFLPFHLTPIYPGVSAVEATVGHVAILDRLLIGREPPGLSIVALRHNGRPVVFVGTPDYYTERIELAPGDRLAVDVFNWSAGPLNARVAALLYVPCDPPPGEEGN